MSNSFRKRLRSGERFIGPMVCLNTPENIEILVGAGFDWLFLDAEHAPQTPVTLQHQMIAAKDVPCLVRLPNDQEIWIKGALDSGAAGIIVPQVNTPHQARAIVRAAKYAPEGQRGVGAARAHGYGRNFADYLARANEDTAVVFQAEHVDAVKNIDAITDVPGLDAIFVGPFDLSASMGKPGQVGDPDVVAAIHTIAKAAKAKEVRLGIFGVSAEAVKPWIAQGFTLIAVGVDTIMYTQAARALCEAVKG